MQLTNSDRDRISAGIGAGVLAGLVMGVLAMCVSGLMGQGFFAPLNLIAGVLWGVDTLVAGPVASVIGLLIHLVVSAAFGAAFSLLTRKQGSVRDVLIAGLGYGAVIWLVMTYFVLPWANPTMSDRVALMPGWWFIEHLAFGGSLCLTPLIARRAMTLRDETDSMDGLGIRRRAA